MMFDDDSNCRWCGRDNWESVWPLGRVRRWTKHDCPNKPPQTAEEGAAVAFGLMGMAEAIRKNERIEACHDCGRAPVFGSGRWFGKYAEYRRWTCRDCFHAASPATGSRGGADG